jgi:hypothetical protein
VTPARRLAGWQAVTGAPPWRFYMGLEYSPPAGNRAARRGTE